METRRQNEASGQDVENFDELVIADEILNFKLDLTERLFIDHVFIFFNYNWTLVESVSAIVTSIRMTRLVLVRRADDGLVIRTRRHLAIWELGFILLLYIRTADF
mmetsp:Transcript_374/g.320  ORF Transcript_374/g.320 Transcript_374/m.320 type:complete len:105 (-) Transcript_374:938-1252(-)